MAGDLLIMSGTTYKYKNYNGTAMSATRQRSYGAPNLTQITKLDETWTDEGLDWPNERYSNRKKSTSPYFGFCRETKAVETINQLKLFSVL
jgi:hypothetical protein